LGLKAIGAEGRKASCQNWSLYAQKETGNIVLDAENVPKPNKRS